MILRKDSKAELSNREMCFQYYFLRKAEIVFMDEPSLPQHTHIPGNRETVFPLMPDERIPYFMHFLWFTMRVYRTHSVLIILYFT